MLLIHSFSILGLFYLHLFFLVNSIEKGLVPHWFKYFLCGIKGVLECGSTNNTGLNAVCYGLVPPSAGLSSSSALVCSAAMAYAHLNQLSLSKQQLADLCARSERYETRILHLLSKILSLT